MRKYFITFTILISVSFSSCTVPLELSLFNNTSYKILVELRKDKIRIDPGTTEIITGMEYAVLSITSKAHSLKYEAPSLHSSKWIWKGWGPFSTRMYYAQLEENGYIWFTSPEDTYPVIIFGEQPEGFPIEPIT